MKILTLLPIAAPVLIGATFDIEGVITGINIRPGLRIEYEVSWWDAGQKREAWFDTFEVKMKAESKRLKVGFESSFWKA